MPTADSHDAPADEIQLDAGGRSFSAFACGQGTPVLCVHGFPDTHRSFRLQLPAFERAGLRAVAPLLRGYEASSQGPPGRRHVPDYHPRRIANDVIAWARSLGGGRRIHLIGHDWGGIVAELAIALEPGLFASAALIAAPPMHAAAEGVRAHPGQIRNSWYTLFFQLRGLADWTVRSRDFAFLEKLWRDWSPDWRWEPADMVALKQCFREPGVLWCALAYYRAMLNPFLADSREARTLAERVARVPTLVITGARDGCMDTRIFDFIDSAHFAEGHRLERIPDAGHFAHQEKPEAVNRLLLDWIGSHPAAR